jgi:hypothetical protein
MRSSRRPSSHLFFFFGAFFAGLALAKGAVAQPPQTFSEQLDIREGQILVSLPTNLANARLQPADFQVLVDGQPREVTRAEPVSGPGAAPWTILIYVDRVLAGPGTAFSSEVALADHARDLTRLGTVEVAEADADARTVLAPTREARVVEQQLAALSSAARLERDRAAAGKAAPPPSDSEIRGQVDKLLAFLAGRHPAGPRVLFLVADGSELPPSQVAILTGAATPPPGSPPTAATELLRASRQLAVQGWVAVPVAMRPAGPGDPVAPRSNIELFHEGSSPSGHTNGPPPIVPGRPPKENSLSYGAVIDLSTEPRMATLHVLAEATAGTVIGYDVQLAALLAELPHRWTIWISVPPESKPATAAEGSLHALTVKLPGKAAEGRAPAWLP